MPNKKEQEFNFASLNDEQTIVDEDEIATGGSPNITLKNGSTITLAGDTEDPIISASPLKIHQGLTREQIEMAQAASQSRKGLDMAAFITKTGIVQIDFDQLLSFKLPTVS